MAKAFYSRSVKKYLKAVAQMKAANKAVLDANHLSGDYCIILCLIAEFPGITYSELVQKSGLHHASVSVICGTMQKKEAIRTERGVGGHNPNRLFLTETGEASHARILKNG